MHVSYAPVSSTTWITSLSKPSCSNRKQFLLRRACRPCNKSNPKRTGPYSAKILSIKSLGIETRFTARVTFRTVRDRNQSRVHWILPNPGISRVRTLITPRRIWSESEPLTLATEKNAGCCAFEAPNPPSPVRMRESPSAKTPRNRGNFSGCT